MRSRSRVGSLSNQPDFAVHNKSWLANLFPAIRSALVAMYLAMGNANRNIFVQPALQLDQPHIPAYQQALTSQKLPVHKGTIVGVLMNS
jgi:hypothetical protein